MGHRAADAVLKGRAAEGAALCVAWMYYYWNLVLLDTGKFPMPLLIARSPAWDLRHRTLRRHCLPFCGSNGSSDNCKNNIA